MRKDSRILRFLGVVIGVIIIVVMPTSYIAGVASALSVLSGVVVGLVFIIYGFGGSKKLSKIFPSLNRKPW